MQQRRDGENQHRENRLSSFSHGFFFGLSSNFIMTHGANIDVQSQLERQSTALLIATGMFITGVVRQDHRLTGTGVGIAVGAAWHVCKEIRRWQEPGPTATSEFRM